MALSNDRIDVLSPSLVEKIAAGEVIERPASVVKELVENAVDARATRIAIAIENAGFSLIRVADNGTGMSADNLARSVLRHATSKIRSLDDLFSLTTMGFRGEALASIGAIARMTIATSAATDGLGFVLSVDGGKAAPVSPVSHGRGTTIEVRDLFFNTPARRKFMKSDRSERAAVSKLIEELVVPFCSVHFVLTIDNQTVLDAPPVPGVRERIAQIMGDSFARRLIECAGSFDAMQATVLVSPPGDISQRPRCQNLYVNLRRIDSDTVTFSLRNAYKTATRIDARPSFVCFLEIDPARVDVNVHPTKQKIKFDDERRIGGGIFKVVHAGLNAVLNPSAGYDGGGFPSEIAESSDLPGLPGHGGLTSAEPGGAGYGAGNHSAEGGAEASGPDIEAMQQVLLPFGRAPDIMQKRLENQRDAGVQLSGAIPNESWDLISCVQVHDLFICVQIKNGILFIDQHAAHERILFEDAVANLDKGYAESQQLLFPVTVELTPTEKSMVLSNLDWFTRFGYEIQEQSGNTISVTATPVVSDAPAAVSIREMVGFLLDE
jgi:DNA mismatch repair protein MutL